MYVCGKCGTHCDKPKLRYKIKIRVYDAKGSAPFLLWDREALELLGGITAEELKAMQPKKATNSVELLDDDLDSDAGFFSDEEAESPLPNALTQVTKGGGNDSEAVKRRLLDEFSSTQCPKKKTHTAIIKLEKDSDLGFDQNSENTEI
nr:replication factor A protein 1-like [Ipomoea batatas]